MSPDCAAAVEGQGPVELVRLEPVGVHLHVVGVLLVTPGQVRVELGDEARHEDP